MDVNSNMTGESVPESLVNEAASCESTPGERKTDSSVEEMRCNVCRREFDRKFALKRHELTHETPPKYECDACKKIFARKDNLTKHVKKFHANTSKMEKIRERVPAKEFHDVLCDYHHRPEEGNSHDVDMFLTAVRPDIACDLRYELSRKRGIKWYAVLTAELTRDGLFKDEERTIGYFRNSCVIDMTEDTIESHITDAFEKIRNSLEEFEGRGSGWVLDRILLLELKIGMYAPLASYR